MVSDSFRWPVQLVGMSNLGLSLRAQHSLFKIKKERSQNLETWKVMAFHRPLDEEIETVHDSSGFTAGDLPPWLE